MSIRRLMIYTFELLPVVATMAPLMQKEAWWIRIFDFPRLQVAVIAVFLLAGNILFRNANRIWDRVFMLLLTGVIVYQICMIFPYTPIARKEVLDAEGTGDGAALSLLISNVYMPNRNVEAYIEIIRRTDPDIILVAEANHWWEQQLRKIEKEHPFTLKYPLENTYGMLLYSRLQLIDAEVKFLVEKDIPSMHSMVAMKSGDLVELHCLHPRPPHPKKSPGTEERDAELLLVGKTVRKSTYPTIVAGDLNDVAWSYTTKLFQKISGLLDPRIGRGLYNTFHAKYPVLRFPLDHVFHSNHFKLVKLERQAHFGSDHFPIYIQLSYEPQSRGEQEAPSPERKDLKEAEKKIEQVK
jgi:endonuclease/exonuclease/phosphatase (EEP) superfamily protein YafD